MVMAGYMRPWVLAVFLIFGVMASFFLIPFDVKVWILARPGTRRVEVRIRPWCVPVFIPVPLARKLSAKALAKPKAMGPDQEGRSRERGRHDGGSRDEGKPEVRAPIQDRVRPVSRFFNLFVKRRRPISKLLARAISGIEVKELFISGRLGMDDAAATAILCGSVNAGLSLFFRLLEKWGLTWKKPPSISVYPVYGEYYVEVEIRAWFKIHLLREILNLLSSKKIIRKPLSVEY